ncbi:MAG: class I SAM-dependent RNA methyltransferase [Candidatus Omnitrophica bacterium]|nr:class I SAM-dependent RNA methyltransferase [Candidatus Omnitrophota bacterium]
MDPIPEDYNLLAEEVRPLCPVFGLCQGCSYQNIPYPDELRQKEQWLKDLLAAPLAVADSKFSPIVPSPRSYYYRNRIDLKLKRTKERGVLIGFTPVEHRGILPVEACFIAEKNISDFIPALKKDVMKRLPDKYRIANVVVRTGDDGRVLWGGIGRRSCCLSQDDYLWTRIADKKIFYSLDTFFQANLSILPELFKAICSLDFWRQAPVFYDLYGGVGLFAIGLADQAERVILIEENPSSVTLARYNRKVNNAVNVRIMEGKVEDKLPEYFKNEPGKVKAAMIDPPRAGLSARACRQLAQMRGIDHILYLSCSPESLARDLTSFVQQGWNIKQIMPFDFFPKTKHLETLVLLSGG